ncbi:DUF2000 domain-containing protein [Dickeya fangzhongdai]|uniref:DUF2000 domain-containing protein n=1 Tax=Dickeya fangzhongdai TaxID=1778540 RepID=UPI0026DF3468|nr:DUF2000 domain-containing protein [Dickeya fangzhongdai]WKV52731.1 DUF2000 domain-containing protein [Dickeya fangzhongdai]
MKFDVTSHKCTIVIDKDLGAGLSINAASVIGISFGRTVDNLVGPDMQSQDAVNYPGVIYAPLPVLLAPGGYVQELLRHAEADDEIYSMPFSALAQSCRTYDEYGERISAVNSDNIELVAIGLIGPKKKITRLTGNLPLFK